MQAGDSCFQVIGKRFIGRVLVGEQGFAAAVYRHLQRIQQAAAGRGFDIGIVGMPEQPLAAGCVFGLQEGLAVQADVEPVFEVSVQRQVSEFQGHFDVQDPS